MQPYHNYPQNGQPCNYPQNGQPYQYYPQGTQQYPQWPDQDVLIEALMPNYTGKAIIVFILYFCGYLPGLICNIVLLIVAFSTMEQFKRTPRGMTLLIILLVIGVGLPLLAFGCAIALSNSFTR